jgi:hypothetical protein
LLHDQAPQSNRDVGIIGNLVLLLRLQQDVQSICHSDERGSGIVRVKKEKLEEEKEWQEAYLQIQKTEEKVSTQWVPRERFGI